MPISSRREALVLLIGDLCFLAFSLWATLLIRYGQFPSGHILSTHLVPFSFLFLFSVIIFLITGLYEKHTLLVKSKLPEMVFYAQVANIAVGAIFFFLVPFGIQPKTNLVIYLFLSTVLVSAWRLYLFPFFSAVSQAPALLVGTGKECAETLEEVNGNTRYTVRFVEFCDTKDIPAGKLREAIAQSVKHTGASIVVIPLSLLREAGPSPRGDALMLAGARFIDFGDLYEDLFDRVALPFLEERWFLEAEGHTPTVLYDIFKRASDIALSATALAVLSPVFLGVIAIMHFFEGGRSFIAQKRVGRDGREVGIIKFRTMLFDDGEDPEKKKQNRVTSFGGFLRKTQIDEFPQFWNVLKGDLSLIGPRPEIPHFVREYAAVIPYYETRHLIPPGISGWAQIKHASPPKFRLDVEATRAKLSYDLYYLKHRSFLLDMEIVLRTLKIVFARASK